MMDRFRDTCSQMVGTTTSHDRSLLSDVGVIKIIMGIVVIGTLDGFKCQIISLSFLHGLLQVVGDVDRLA